MKYRDLEYTFAIEDVTFTVSSIVLETLENPIPMHSHSKNSYELHYIAGGYGKLRLKDTEYSICPRTYFVTGPGVGHEQTSVPQSPMIEYCIYLKVHASKEQLCHADTLVRSFVEKVFWFGQGDAQTHALMKQIISELEHREEGYPLILQALLQQVILLLSRKYLETENSVSFSPESSHPTNDLTYLTIEEAFLYDYRSITLDTLARQIGLGPRQTERLLQLHYQQTFQQKKTAARMSAASSILRDTDKSIATIAEELGYSSAEHFSNAFRKFYQIAPTQFRKQELHELP